MFHSPVEDFAVPACVLMGLLGCAGLLLDQRGRVLFLNETARRCLGDGLTLHGKRLTATDHEADARLQRLIELALASTGSPPAIMSMGLQRVCKRPLLVRILHLEDSARPALNSATLLIVALDPEIYPEPPPDILKQAFALTPTEARVAIGIVSGRNLAEISSDLGVKAGTVRTHLKSVFSKTRTRGQAELVGLLTRVAFVAPHRLRSAAVTLVSESASNGDRRRDAAGLRSLGAKPQGGADHSGTRTSEPVPPATQRQKRLRCVET
jgi:DNA-binding CsgD family transcriptional regulator